MDFLRTLLEDLGRLSALASPLVQFLAIIRAMVGFALVFFLPGFAWTLVFFKKIKVVERITLSLGLSIALVTLSVLFLNLALGMKINLANSVLTIVVITAVPLAIYYAGRIKASSGHEKR